MIERGAIFWGSEKGVLTGKPRPLLVLQNSLAADHTSVSVAFISSALAPPVWFRVRISPNDSNGLLLPSEVQVDRLFSFRSSALERRIGILNRDEMAQVDSALRRWLDL
jgi:mRNA-degrading endonuclease toxin of MazEF toxin-antitoxin module